VLQTEVLDRFRNDDDASVRAVLTDLVESGLVFRSGRAESTTLRTAGPDELSLAGESGADEKVGGSTCGFTVWEGHPHEDEVFGTLSRLRAGLTRPRQKVREYNAQNPPKDKLVGVVVYFGQTLIESGHAEVSP